MDELQKKTEQHFTIGELAEFLGLSVEDLFDRFEDVIEANYTKLVEEVCFEFEED